MQGRENEGEEIQSHRPQPFFQLPMVQRFADLDVENRVGTQPMQLASHDRPRQQTERQQAEQQPRAMSQRRGCRLETVSRLLKLAGTDWSRKSSVMLTA